MKPLRRRISLPAVSGGSETTFTSILNGGNMPTKLRALMAPVFLCLLICVLAAPAWSQDPRQGRGDGQRGGRGQVALPDGPGKEAVQMQCTKCHALGLI